MGCGPRGQRGGYMAPGQRESERGAVGICDGGKAGSTLPPPAPSLSAPAVGISRLLPTGKAGRVVGIVRAPNLCHDRCARSPLSGRAQLARGAGTVVRGCHVRTRARSLCTCTYVLVYILLINVPGRARRVAAQASTADLTGPAREGLVVRVRASFLRVFARQKPDRGLARFSSAWVRWNQGLNGAERPGIYVRTSSTLKVVYRL